MAKKEVNKTISTEKTSATPSEGFVFSKVNFQLLKTLFKPLIKRMFFEKNKGVNSIHFGYLYKEIQNFCLIAKLNRKGDLENT